METGSWDWGYDRGVVFPDYALFHRTLPRLMAEEDPGRRLPNPVRSCSPDGLHPNANEVGDQHPWSVGFQNTDFRDYRKMICRFPNEGGTLGPTSLPTMLACLPKDQRYVQSFAWQVNDNSLDSWGEPSYPDLMITQWLGKDIRKMSIEEFTYWGGLLQGEALREYCENFRRRMFDTSAAIFWMLNDCWPATRKLDDHRLLPAAHAGLCGRPSCHATPACDRGRGEKRDRRVRCERDAPRVERPGALRTLQSGGWTTAGPDSARDPAAQCLHARIASFKKREWKNPSVSAAFALLVPDDAVMARNRLFLPFFKDLKWAAPKLRVRREKGKAIFQSDTFVWGVCLDLDGKQPVPDNFFDVSPGIPHVIPWKGSRPPECVKFVGNLIRKK